MIEDIQNFGRAFIGNGLRNDKRYYGDYMKRSEMIWEIAKDLICQDEISYPEKYQKSLPFSTYINDAEALLDKIEKLGMKPPYRKRTESEKELIGEGGMNFMVYTQNWEKET